MTKKIPFFSTLYSNTMSYADAASQGNVVNTLRHAILTGTLWAIGISWSTAIRSVTLLLVPDDSFDQIIGELLSTVIVTVIGVGTALAVGWCGRRPRDATARTGPPSRNARV